MRIIAASSTDLREDVLPGKFLPELLYRINAVTINIPPLRERREGIVFLAEHFLELFQAEQKGKEVSLDMEARLALESYEWSRETWRLQLASLAFPGALCIEK